MQPTLLVKSNFFSQILDFNNQFSKASCILSIRLAWWTRRLKELGWTAAFGSLFVFAQTYALSLQSIQINSALGEPLDAVVQINAASGEYLQASCMQTGADAASGMPGIRGVQLSLSRQLSPGTLRLTTRQPVNEPMSEVVLQIDCPGAPAMKRTFLIMLDPAGVSEAAATRSAAGPGASASPDSLNSPASRTRPLDAPLITSNDSRINVNSRRITVTPGMPIKPGSRYVVTNGDALSTIAARIQGRDYGTVWSWASTIEAANPHAFINGNPNELIAGIELYVPQTLAAGTAGLTVPAPGQDAITRSPAATAAPVAVALSRYADRFSTGTNAPVAGAMTDEDGPAIPEEPLLAVNVSGQVTNSGAIRAIQPVMVMATSFSSVSRDRLRQRSMGLIQSAPADLPDFVRGEATNDPDTQTTSDQANTLPDEPGPQQTQSPTTPVATKPELGAASTNGRRLSFLGLLAGLGLLAASFFAGWLLSRRRADAEMQEIVQARLAEERYHERVRSDRQSVTRAVHGAAASGIQVTESETEAFDSEPVVTGKGSDDAIAVEVKEEATDSMDFNVANPVTDNEGPLIEAETVDFDTGDHQLADVDLELLERDYAAQTETNANLEDIASAGAGNKTSIMETALDMEFPEDLKIRSETEKNFDTLEFDLGNGSLDFDIGEHTLSSKSSEDLGMDLEEAGADLDAQLEQLRLDDLVPQGEDAGLHSDQEVDLDIENLLDGLPSDDEHGATSTRNAEEFYHLEASSIMNLGELDFEKESDDETNILRFRQRNIRTGTDDPSGDEE